VKKKGILEVLGEEEFGILVMSVLKASSSFFSSSPFLLR
jgi:hypothetical protein